MSSRFAIGVLAYDRPTSLHQTILAIEGTVQQEDWHGAILDNASPQHGEAISEIIRAAVERTNGRWAGIVSHTNLLYAGGVNRLMRALQAEYVAYFDHDSRPMTKGWDVLACGLLDRYHEIGLVLPGQGGAYPIHRPAYDEVLWGIGCAFVISRLSLADLAAEGEYRGSLWSGKGTPMDEALGHQEEVDLQMRLRMLGRKIVNLREATLDHGALTTSEPSAATQERIAAGVRRWVDKWCEYFGGRPLNYHSDNVLRFDDWPPSALYLEEYWQLHPTTALLNTRPDTLTVDGREYDLIKVPRYAKFYRGRVI